MRIHSFLLENFQGIKYFEACPEGKSFSIYGDNGTGKTTVANAFTWLLFGKASTGEKGFSPKTVGTHGLSHIVEMTLEADDLSTVILRKEYHEVYKTVRGRAEKTFAGHTCDYFVDGVPVQENEYKKRVELLCGPETEVKMLTLPGYFLGEYPMKERRQVLLDVCGDVSMDDVIASDRDLQMLPAFLRKPGNGEYTVDEYLSIARREKSLIDKELKSIPQRIDEAEKAKPDVGNMTEETAKASVDALTEELKEAEASLAAACAETEESRILRQLAQAKNDYLAGEARYDSDNLRIRQAWNEKISAMKEEAAAKGSRIRRMMIEKKDNEENAAAMSVRRQRYLDEWKAESKKEWGGDPVCPTCGQPLPEDQAREAERKFNLAKSRRLGEICDLAQSCTKDMIKSEEDKAAALAEQIAQEQKDLDALQERIQSEEEPVFTSYEETDSGKEQMNLVMALKAKQKGLTKTDVAEKSHVDEVRDRLFDAREILMNVRAAEKQRLRIQELKDREKELGNKYEQFEHGVWLCEKYSRRKAELLDERINSCFGSLRFRLFIDQVNGGLADDCEALVDCGPNGWVPYKSANHASQVNAGLEAINALSRHFKMSLPVFIDNAESVTRLQKTEAQLIRLVVSEGDKDLRWCE